MRILGHVFTAALVLLLVAQVLGFTFILGALHGAERIRRDACAEGLGLRETDADGHETFRWKTVAELERKPARRDQNDLDNSP